MVHSFDRVAVGVTEERAVVGVVVLRSRPGFSVTFVASLGHAVPPAIDSVSIGDAESDVQVVGERMLLIDGLDAEVAPLDPLAFDGRWTERLAVEGAACRQVGDGDVDVVEHA